MKHKRGTKLLGVLLSLALMLSLIPGMSLTAYAEDVTESFTTTGNGGEITGTHFKISGTKGDSDGFAVGGFGGTTGNTITVSSLNGENITKIEATIGYVNTSGTPGIANANPGTLSGTFSKGNTITVTNINATSVTFSIQSGSTVQFKQFVVSKNENIPVTGVTLSPNEAQTIEVGGSVAFTATVEPSGATDKTVKWIASGGVTLYSDSNCTQMVGTAATSTLTVYAKGVSAGSATVTATSNADDTKSASCAVTVNPLEPVSYMVWNGTKLVEKAGDDACKDYTVVTANTTTFENGKWYVVNTPSAQNLTNSNRITVSGTANLILCDGAKLTASQGIQVKQGNTLNIYAQSEGTGALIANGADNCAGIGGIMDSGGAGGTVKIHGGNITATGGDDGAGIGGGTGVAGGNVTIYGGSVTATGNGTAAGIGGASNGGNGGTFTIYGGSVIANGGSYSAGIGGAAGCDGGSVTIHGGTVTATGGNNAMGIGKGLSMDGNVNGPLTVATTHAVYSHTAAITDANKTDAAAKAQGTGAAMDIARNRYMLVEEGVLHFHTLTDYTVNGDTITAVCTNTVDCTLADKNYTATLTIGAPATGSYEATLTGASDFGVTAADINYYFGETKLEAAPTTDGFYQARITVGGVTASVSYGVNAISKDDSFDETSAHGKFDTLPAVAAVGASVEITTLPDPGYQLEALTVKKANGDTVNATVTGNTGSFIMPGEAVTVSATFTKRNVPVKLTVEGSGGTAVLLDDAYNGVKDTDAFSKKAGDTFILRIDRDDDYAYKVTYGAQNTPITTTEFSKTEYEAYAAYATENGITVPPTTVLVWATVPGIAEGDLTATVTFSKLQTFTVLYQPSGTGTTAAWCKLATDGVETAPMKMQSDAVMGNNTVYSLKVTAGFAPTKVAFAATKEAVDAVQTNAMNGCSAKTSVAYSEWTTMADNNKFVMIGGNARTVVAAFVSDADAVAVYKDNAYNEAKAGVTGGVTYQLAVVTEADGGKVIAPPAPEKEGSNFGGWRGFVYDSDGKATEMTYEANKEVPVRKNTTFNAVWTPVTPTVSINQNNGAEIKKIEATYNQPISEPETIEKIGFALENWLVGESVTESGKFLPEGVPFDFKTPITDDLELDAQWKHVHSYTCVPLNYFGNALEDYFGYLPYIHVKFCGCADVKLEAHTFQNGVCTGCGYKKSGTTDEVTLTVSYWKDGASPTKWMNGETKNAKKNTEVTVDAFDQIGTFVFSKWQYSTDSGAHWYDLAAATMVGFIIPCSMEVRAIYIPTINEPQIELSARNYVTEAQGYNWDSVLFQMNYKLPEGYTLIDAGVRMGDNNGISYYELKERTYTMDGEAKAIGVGICVVTSILDGGVNTFEGSASEKYYAERENSVLDEYSAETLADYMMKSKPVNVEKYPPIYWEAKAETKGQTGSVNTLTPLRFIQKNNGNHFIYGVAWMTYKAPNGVTGTLYTKAIPVTRNNPNGYASATPNA